ncbi:MAG: hypothetical protein ABI837_03900 [Acidobacteriota bacterium]
MPTENALSPESTPELEHLLNALLEFARLMLDEQGEFFPFGAALKEDGLIHSVPVDLAKERPTTHEVLDTLIAAFKEHAQDDAVRAIGICTDAHILMPDGIRESDAISVQLEHRRGESLVVFLPYQKPLLAAIRYEPVFAAERGPVVFVTETPN